MSVRRTLLVLTLVALSLPMIAFSSRANQMQAESPQRNLQLHTVALGNVQLTISAVGEVEADSVADLSVTRSGRVVERLVEPGDYVEAGDVLLRLDSDAQQLAVQQAELALASAELSLQDILEGPDEGDIRIAEANVTSAWGSYQALANAVDDADIQAADLRYQQATDSFIAANEARRLAHGDSEESIALLDADIGEASFNMEIARLQLESLRDSNGPDLNAALARVTQAQAELERAQAGATEPEIRAVEVTVEQAQTDLDQALADLEKRQLVAPFSGVVSAVHTEVGAIVSPGSPLVELVDVEPMRVTVDVDEIDIRAIHEGMPATVEIDALADVLLPASLERIALVGQDEEGIISYNVEVALNDVDPRVRVGMTAEAAVIVESRENVLVVPNEYIRLERRLDRAYVNRVQDDGTLTEVEVELGLQGEIQSEIVSGVSEGDVIAVDLDGGFSILGG